MTGLSVTVTLLPGLPVEAGAVNRSGRSPLAWVVVGASVHVHVTVLSADAAAEVAAALRTAAAAGGGLPRLPAAPAATDRQDLTCVRAQFALDGDDPVKVTPPVADLAPARVDVGPAVFAVKDATTATVLAEAFDTAACRLRAPGEAGAS